MPGSSRAGRDRDPQCRQAARDARAAGALRRRGRLGRRAEPAGAGRDRHDVRGERRHQGAGGDRGHRAAGFADDSGLASMPSDGAPACSRPLVRRLEGFLGGDGPHRAGADEPQCHRPPRALVSALVLAWPDGHEELFEGGCSASWSGRPGATRASATTRCFKPDESRSPSASCPRREKHGIDWASAKPLAPGPRLPGAGSRLPARPDWTPSMSSRGSAKTTPGITSREVGSCAGSIDATVLDRP